GLGLGPNPKAQPAGFVAVPITTRTTTGATSTSPPATTGGLGAPVTTTRTRLVGAPFFLRGERQVDYNELTLYNEVATGRIGIFVEVPYREIDPRVVPHAAGFSDMNVGTKTLMFDCELIQVGFLFRTYIPTGNTRKGLGNGHASLEPGLLVTVKLAPDTYCQGELEEWIPLGGDPSYAGAIFHWHCSLN